MERGTHATPPHDRRWCTSRADDVSATTRASLRGRIIAAAEDARADLSVDWVHARRVFDDSVVLQILVGRQPTCGSTRSSRRSTPASHDSRMSPDVHESRCQPRTRILPARPRERSAPAASPVLLSSSALCLQWLSRLEAGLPAICSIPRPTAARMSVPEPPRSRQPPLCSTE